jgi:hypothetical protein
MKGSRQQTVPTMSKGHSLQSPVVPRYQTLVFLTSLAGAGVVQSAWWPGYRLDDWGLIPGRGRDFFLFAIMSRLALGLTQPSLHWVLGVKLLELEADHSSASSAEVKNTWSYTFTPPLCLHGMVLN